MIQILCIMPLIVSAVQGDMLAAKVWHLRPSLMWTDGEWIEWCRPGQDGTHKVIYFVLSM